jgi:hypothetical protein
MLHVLRRRLTDVIGFIGVRPPMCHGEIGFVQALDGSERDKAGRKMLGYSLRRGMARHA